VRTLLTGAVSVGEALALGPALLARAAADRIPVLAASVVFGPAIVLGAMQRAGRVVLLPACAEAGVTVFRRATTGTAAYVGGLGIVWSLALPHVASLAPDATPRTLLNRNVRGFLKGLGQVGALAHYFGREWIAVRRRPAAILGFDVTREGAVLLDVLAGVDTPIAVPEALAADDERAVDRWRGAEPIALGEVVRADPHDVARSVMDAVASRAPGTTEAVAFTDVARLPPVTREHDPMPEGFTPRPGLRVPIGWIDAGYDEASQRAWIGGDVLAPVHVFAALADGKEPEGDGPIEGATLEDLRAAVSASSKT
jgi:hypothetical protein